MGYRIDEYLNPAEVEELIFAGGHDFGSEGKLKLIFADKGQSDESFVVDVAHESIGQDYALGEAHDGNVFAAIAPKGKLIQFLKTFKK